MPRPLEIAVAHLNSIDSAWSLDLKLLTAGLADACARIEALEKITAAALAQAAKPAS